MTEPRKYRYRDLKAGDAYYEAWRGRWRSWFLLLAKLVLVVVVGCIAILSTFDLVTLLASVALQLYSQASAHLKVIQSGILALMFAWIISASLREAGWPCPRCAQPYSYRSVSTLYWGAFTGGILYPLGLAALGYWKLGGAEGVAAMSEILGDYVYLMLAPRIGVGAILGLSIGQLIGVWRGAKTDPALGWLKSRTRLASRVCVNCLLPRWAPDDPDREGRGE